tara:strand:+ start:2222 stop:2593 length:372 start_codon:yes stop_codon:yes gene_type:complete
MPLHDIKCRDCTHIYTVFLDSNGIKKRECEKCKSENTFIFYGNFKRNIFCGISYFDDISGKDRGKLTSKQIDKKCKEEGMVYGSNDEIMREAKRYKGINEKESEQRNEVLTDKILKVFKERGA